MMPPTGWAYADHPGDDVADAHAVAHLRQRAFVVVAEHLQRAVLESRRLRRQHGCNRRGFHRHLLLAGGVAERAPGRHRPLSWAVDLRVRVETRLDGKRSCAGLVWVGSHAVSSGGPWFRLADAG